MSDGILSQKEIDALLGGSLPDENDDVNLDAIGNVLTAIVEPWVLALSDTLQESGSVKMETLLLDNFETFGQQIGRSVFTEVQLEADYPGVAFILLPAAAVTQIASSVLGNELSSEELSEDVLQALAVTFDKSRSEMAAVLSSLTGSSVNVRLTPPQAADLDAEGESDSFLPFGEEVFQALYNVSVGDFSFEVYLQIPRAMVSGVLSLFTTSSQITDEPITVSEPLREPEPIKASVQEVSFGEFEQPLPRSERSNLDFLLDVPLQVTVELGRTRMQIRDVLDLGKGSVVELEKLAGEPVEVFVNGTLIAKGEVVTIDENFGVKITEIVSKAERVHSLQ